LQNGEKRNIIKKDGGDSVNLSPGTKFNIHSYKHNGKIHRSWDEAVYIGEAEGYQIFGNYKTIVTESDGRTWRTKEPAIMFFSKKSWFNIIGQIKYNGIYYYCNLASPYIIEKNTIKYIDYDLDLRVFADGAFKILDRGEYKYHKRIMNYPVKIDRILKEELSNLIDIVRSNAFPFKKYIVEEYYKKYKNLEIYEKEK